MIQLYIVPKERKTNRFHAQTAHEGCQTFVKGHSPGANTELWNLMDPIMMIQGTRLPDGRLLPWHIPYNY